MTNKCTNQRKSLTKITGLKPFRTYITVNGKGKENGKDMEETVYKTD